MGYENRYSLSLSCDKKQLVEITKCPSCDNINDGNFCNKCGTKLVTYNIEKQIDTIEIIKEFRKYSEDASYLINNKGKSNECGNGYNIEKDIKTFSKEYPDVLFELLCEWDSGFGDPPTKNYIKNGKMYNCNSVYVFPEFDESKLK